MYCICTCIKNRPRQLCGNNKQSRAEQSREKRKRRVKNDDVIVVHDVNTWPGDVHGVVGEGGGGGCEVFSALCQVAGG